MGGIVKSIKKAVKGFLNPIGKAVGGLLGAQMDQPAMQQSAIQLPDAPRVDPEIETEVGGKSAVSQGKKSLTVKRTPMGGGRGINM